MVQKVPDGSAPWEQWRQWQFEQLSSLLQYAYDNSLYYRDSFVKTRLKPKDVRSWEDLAKIPFISKETVIEDQQKNPPYGSLLAVAPSTLKYIFCYGGLEFIVFDGAEYDSKEDDITIPGVEIRENDIVNITASFHWVGAGLGMLFNARRRGAAVIPSGPGQAELQVQVMRLTKATVLVGFPTFVEHVAEIAKGMGLDPRTDLSIRLAFVFGEMWPDAMRRKIEETFGMDTVQAYGAMEVGQSATECKLKNGMHVDPRIILEVIDPDTENAVPPGHPGEIVLTALKNRTQPMVRFRTHDITSGLDFTPCPCGFSSPRLGNIIGRTGNILRVRGLWVTPKQIQEVVSGHPELGRFQAILERPGTQDVLTVRVQQTQACNAQGLVETLKNELKSKINLSCMVELVAAEEIPEGAPPTVDKRKLNL